jgi:hypothetical protein
LVEILEQRLRGVVFLAADRPDCCLGFELRGSGHFAQVVWPYNGVPKQVLKVRDDGAQVRISRVRAKAPIEPATRVNPPDGLQSVGHRQIGALMGTDAKRMPSKRFLTSAQISRSGRDSVLLAEWQRQITPAPALSAASRKWNAATRSASLTVKELLGSKHHLARVGLELGEQSRSTGSHAALGTPARPPALSAEHGPDPGRRR